MPPSRRAFSVRAAAVLFLLLVGLALAGLRTADLQINQHARLAALARDEYLREVKVPARRGQIMDRHGQSLAISIDVPSLYANPSLIDDPRQAARALAKHLDTDLHTLYQRLATDKYFVWLQRRVDPGVAEAVLALGLPGVATARESKRFYPNRELAAQVLGFVGVDAQGLEGVERSLDDVVSGKRQVVAALRDARGRAVLAAGLDPDARAHGADVYLTLDATIQHVVEDALARVVGRARASSAEAMVLSVPTGEILAMASAPGFNPNTPTQRKPLWRRNRPVTDVYETGSTLKPLVVAAALEGGSASLDDVIFCENGAMEVGGHTIRDTKPHGWLGLTQIIAKSSNIGSAKIGFAMGSEALYKALRAYGFGAPTGLRFPGEAQGIVRPPKTWSSLEVATTAFGHGLAVTTLQLATAYAVLASGGVYRAPTLIRRVVSPDGHDMPLPRRRGRRVLKPQVAAAVMRMMEAVVAAGGTGPRAEVVGYRVAGKTGTAQKPDPHSGGYSNELFVASFTGVAPADRPAVVVAVKVDEPRVQHSGGAVAAPVFAEIVAAVLPQLGILPSERVSEPLGEEKGAEAGSEGKLPVIDSTHVAPVAADSGIVPSFVGFTARQVVARVVDGDLPFEVELTGTGVAARQKPLPGTRWTDSTRVSIVLLPRDGK